MTSINNDRSYWIDGIQDETPPGSLVVSRIGVRKAYLEVLKWHEQLLPDRK